MIVTHNYKPATYGMYIQEPVPHGSPRPQAASLASRKEAQNRARIHCKSCHRYRYRSLLGACAWTLQKSASWTQWWTIGAAIYLSIYPSIYLSIYIYLYLFIYLFTSVKLVWQETWQLTSFREDRRHLSCAAESINALAPSRLACCRPQRFGMGITLW